MSFNSVEFLLFLPSVVLLHWIVPHKWRWVVLLAASLYFYMSWNVWFVGLIALTTLTAYGGGLIIPRCQKAWQKKVCLAVTLIVCLGVLFFFKYADFLAESVVALINAFGGGVTYSPLNLLLPVGISFYTFQTLSYVIDVYRGTVEAERHLGYFALYVCFFPQLVAGPIERYGDLMPQLRAERNLNLTDVQDGCRWLLSGFIRKCVVADTVGVCVNRVYADLGQCNGLAVFLASALFFLQIYNDFAGYSEIAMGSARLLGVRLTLNFDRPLRSASVTEFFRRWHITLNRWFTDYVYIPLGGNRKGMARKILNTLIVFALCGLWHGADWTYVLWGAVAGVSICIESLLRKPFKALCARHPFWNSPTVWAVRRVAFFCLFSLSCVMFRSTSMADIGVAFRQIFTAFDVSREGFSQAFSSLGLSADNVLFVVAGIVLMALLPECLGSDEPTLPLKRKGIAERTVVYILGIWAVALSWLALSATTGTSNFSYFQF